MERANSVPNLIVPTPPLPIEGWVELEAPVASVWHAFSDVRGWSRWNPRISQSWMVWGRLELGATLVLIFNPIKPQYLYRLPAWAKIVELRPRRSRPAGTTSGA